MKQTAVEWLQEFMNNGKQKSPGIISAAFAKAKEMEKEQIEIAFQKAYLIGVECVTYDDANIASEQYYNETFKSESYQQKMKDKVKNYKNNSKSE